MTWKTLLDDTSDLEDVEEEDVGFELRMKAYRVAWTRCLERMRVSVLSFSAICIP